MNVWITTVTSTEFAGVNTLWAAMTREDFIPDRVHLINLTNNKTNTEFLERSLTEYDCLLRGYGVKENPVVHNVSETDFPALAKELGSIVTEEKSKGHTVAIDMTPGRKIMSAFAMYMGVGTKLKHRADRIYYLFLDGIQNKVPFPMLPSNTVTLYDLKRAIKK